MTEDMATYWICYDLLILSVIIRAALFKGSQNTKQQGRPTPLDPRAAPPQVTKKRRT